MDTQYLIFASNLKYLRKKNGFTQYELRSEFDISSVTWMKYEKGSAPSLQVLLEIATFFNVSIENLLFSDLSQAKEPNNNESANGKPVKPNGQQKHKSDLFLSQAGIPFSEEKVILRHLLWKVKKIKEDIEFLVAEIKDLKTSNQKHSLLTESGRS
jgi:transcriptional regulator with XRE-family HTH domain